MTYLRSILLAMFICYCSGGGSFECKGKCDEIHFMCLRTGQKVEDDFKCIRIRNLCWKCCFLKSFVVIEPECKQFKSIKFKKYHTRELELNEVDNHYGRKQGKDDFRKGRKIVIQIGNYLDDV